MSGHSKWSTIKRKKGAADAKRGQMFTRIARELVLAARDGGSDLDSNFRLRLAYDKARAANMPKDNIERAIKRGTGESKDGNEFEEIMYEGYAPNGIAMMISCVTDNRNRTVAEVRHILNRYGGSMGEGGSVGWQFERMAYFSFPQGDRDQDAIFEMAVDAGADDVHFEDGEVELYATVDAFKQIVDRLRAENIQPEEAGLRMIPTNEMDLGVDDTLQVLRVIDALEELDDVQDVFHNLRVSDEALEAMEQA